MYNHYGIDKNYLKAISLLQPAVIFKKVSLYLLFSVTFVGLVSAQECNCVEKLYLNDLFTDEVHKFDVNSDGSITEVGIPWLAGGNIDAPHGVGIDINGNLYVGEVDSFNNGAVGTITKLSCQGEVLDSDL